MMNYLAAILKRAECVLARAIDRQSAPQTPSLLRVAPAPSLHPRACPRLHKPLRIVRTVEAGRRDSERMVISGRMADVCAELERLAALEAALP